MRRSGPRPARPHGDGGGTRALVEVLLLHRSHAHDDVVAGITAALLVGAVSPDVVPITIQASASRRLGADERNR